jgi:hypothetical protein
MPALKSEFKLADQLKLTVEKAKKEAGETAGLQ